MGKKSNVFQYYVEGKTEEKVIVALKKKYLQPGKVTVLNPVTKEITNFHLANFKSNTVIILVFDTDNDEKTDILEKNIKTLKAQKPVNRVILVPQIGNLEEELIYGTNIKEIRELIPSKSNKEFKPDIIKCSNILEKLDKKSFNIKNFWSRDSTNKFKKYKNNALEIKIIP